MAKTSITLTRRELYERVWAVPLHRLCKEFGLSDRGLAKICARHKIPVPARGVWAKKAHGKPARQPPLPPGPSGSDDTIITISQSPPPDTYRHNGFELLCDGLGVRHQPLHRLFICVFERAFFGPRPSLAVSADLFSPSG